MWEMSSLFSTEEVEAFLEAMATDMANGYTRTGR